MGDRDSKDVVSGLLLGAFGAFIAIYCTINYPLGRLTQLGPGLVPTALGVLLATIGIAIAVGALFRGGSPIRIEWRAAAAALSSVAAFALAIDTLGIVPAIWLLVLISSLADARLSWAKRILLALVLSALGTLIFQVGLGLPVEIFDWPKK